MAITKNGNTAVIDLHMNLLAINGRIRRLDDAQAYLQVMLSEGWILQK